jgi:hypothetical protein
VAGTIPSRVEVVACQQRAVAVLRHDAVPFHSTHASQNQGAGRPEWENNPNVCTSSFGSVGYAGARTTLAERLHCQAFMKGQRVSSIHRAASEQ